jgi:transposase-like protein
MLYRTAQPRPTMRALARQLGVHPEALRSWIHRDRAARAREGVAAPRAGRGGTGAALAPELPADVQAELDGLRVEVMELRRANEILRAASAYFAATLDQTGRPSWGSSPSTGARSGSSRYSGN